MMELLHEFEFTDHCFERISHFVLEHTGIVLGPAKKGMVYSRLVKRVRQQGETDFEWLCEALESGNENEQDYVINAITTNLTAFFRERHHFDYLANTLIPELIAKNKRTKRIRVWSAGCSTGEEAYSLAMTLKEYLPDFEQWDVKILATDIDANVIAKAKRGIYQADHLAGIGVEQLQHHFRHGKEGNSGLVKINAEIRDIVRFKRLNLLHEWPMKAKFDAVFCRNVVIYFGKDTQRILFDRYADILVPNGHLFLGHSETLYKVSERFDLLGHTIYRKKTE
jgi:chemotaxis protein methyltransferase CheR